jgi:putative transposase
MSTFVSLHYHIVFGTKNRLPLIHESWSGRLHEYLGGTANSLEGFVQGVGGVEDHVHLLIGLRPTHRISDFMRELKKASSIWVHEVIGEKDFFWQEGYGIFSVSATNVTQVRAYIANQREHHRTKTFKEEIIAMLKKAGISYDDRYFEG